MNGSAQENNDQPINLDGPSQPELTDQHVAYLYQHGLISRAEADVYTIIANFDDDEQGGKACHV